MHSQLAFLTTCRDWAVCEALELLLDHELDTARKAYRAANDAALIEAILSDAKVALERLSGSAKVGASRFILPFLNFTPCGGDV